MLTGIPSSLKSQDSQAQGSRGSWLLCLVPVLLEFGVHNFECGQEIAKEEDEEGECQHKYLVHPDVQHPAGEEEEARVNSPAEEPA